MLQVGTTFANRYRVERRIAGGGMGSVYEVTDLNIDRRCALKVMLPELASAPRLRERFALEARIPGRAESDHIVQVMDAGLEPTSNHLYLVMELLRGEDLSQRLERQKRLTSAEALTCLRQLASALEKTHALGIIHRDLKPQNLFVGRREDGTLHLKILDFGISKVLQETSVGSQRTEVMGSPQYMAPEQFVGQVPTPATDIFALAMIAYTLLVGDSYWAPEAERFHSPIAFGIHAAKGVHESAVGRAMQLGKPLPAAFDDWFFKAAHLSPDQRYQSASEAVKALAAALDEADAPAAVTSAPERSPATLPLLPVAGSDTMGPMESNGRVAGTRAPFVENRKVALGVAALVGLVGVLLALFINNEPEPPPNAELASAAGEPDVPRTEATATPPTAIEPAKATGATLAHSPPSSSGAPTASGNAAASLVGPSATTDGDRASAVAATQAPTAFPPAAVRPNAPTLTTAAQAPTTTTSAAPKPAARPAATTTAKPAPAAPPSLCYYALSSGRIVKYVPGQSKGAQKTFPCRQNSAGQYTKVP